MSNFGLKGAALAGLALFASISVAAAQDFPTKPIRLLIGSAPGDPSDIIVRLMQNRMNERLGQQWVVEPRAGATGRIASAAVAKSPPDGHTLLVVLSAHAINPASTTVLPYDTAKDFAGVSLLARQPLIVAVHPAVKGATLKEFIAAAQANPGEKLAYATPGSGSLAHLIGEDIARRGKIEMPHVPFKGGLPAIKATLSGETQLIALIGGTLLPHIRTGALRAIAVTSEKRMPEVPDAPTMMESGLGGAPIYNWIGVFAPGGTPRPVIEKLNAEMAQAMKEPALVKWLADGGFEPVASRPEALDAWVAGETARWVKFTRDYDVKFE